MPDDSTLPDLRRPAPPAARTWREVGGAALALTWRVTHPTRADPYLAPTGEVAPVRVYYRADDGWQAPLFHFPPVPGGRGEPVLVAHGLGGSWRDFALEPSRSLTRALTSAGFAVYLFEHRADRSAIPPEGAPAFTVDDIATRDLDAAIAAACRHSGYDRALYVGHGLGAQTLFLRLALLGGDGLAAAVALGGAVRFEVPASGARAAGHLAALLPPRWVLPARRVRQLASPFVESDLTSPDTAGPVVRARLRHAAGDLHAGVVRQVARWVAEGQLTDATGRLDVAAALQPFPALLVEPDADPTCPPGAMEPAAAPLGAAYRRLEGGWGHLDPLMGVRAPGDLHPHVVRFLAARRERC